MPDTDNAASIAAINMASNNISNAANIWSTAKYSKKAQKFNEQNRDIQRGWALQDWNMQNEYNSPKAQRQRMIEANINPALMYGGAVSAASSAGTVKSTGVNQWSPQAPHVDLGSGTEAGIMTYLGVQKQTAELEQMQLQNELLRQKAEGQKATTALTIDKSRLTSAQASKAEMWLKGIEDYNNLPVSQNEVDSGQYTGTDVKRNYISEQNWLGNKNAWQQYSNAFNENQRRDIYTANNSDQIAERIALMKIQEAKTDAEKDYIRENLDVLKKSGILKQMDINGMKLLSGASPYANTLVQLLKLVFGGK